MWNANAAVAVPFLVLRVSIVHQRCGSGRISHLPLVSLCCKTMQPLLLVCLVAALLSVAFAYLPNARISTGILTRQIESTPLFAHHPQMKIIRKKMHRRPKKHRLSDINRNNRNLNKCITKVENAPPEYTIVSAEEFEKVRAQAMEFWQKGDPEAPWIPYIESDFKFTLPQTYSPKTAKERRGPDFVKAGTHWKVPK
eukprot:gene27833-33614_t